MSSPIEQLPRFLGRPTSGYPGFVPRDAAARETAAVDLTAHEAARAGRLWLVQAITGGLLVVFLGVHLVAQHLLAPAGLRDYAAVVDYLRQPVALAAELGLLGSVIVHAVLGVRSTLVEMIRRPRVLRRISIGLAAAGIAAFGYAVWLTATVMAGAAPV